MKKKKKQQSYHWINQRKKSKKEKEKSGRIASVALFLQPVELFLQPARSAKVANSTAQNFGRKFPALWLVDGFQNRDFEKFPLFWLVPAISTKISRLLIGCRKFLRKSRPSIPWLLDSIILSSFNSSRIIEFVPTHFHFWKVNTVNSWTLRFCSNKSIY